MTRKHAPTYQAHVARYAWALPYCYKKIALDAGSGEGFGAHLLSQVANHLTLADKDIMLVDHSRKWFKYFCPVEGLVCDFEFEYPPVTDGYDTVVAFEVIEHLEKPEVFIENVAKSLKAGGKFLFSVPYLMKAPDHKALYNRKKIYELVSKYLTVDKLFVQDKNLDGTQMFQWEGKKPLSCIVGVATK